MEELNGEIVNDAIHSRNRAVEERLNVSLAYRLELDLTTAEMNGWKKYVPAFQPETGLTT